MHPGAGGRGEGHAPAASPAVATPDPPEMRARVEVGYHECCYGSSQVQHALRPRYVSNGVARSGEWEIERAAHVPAWKQERV